MNHLNVMVRI